MYTPVQEETRAVQKVYPVGIELLGFKPRGTVKPDQYVQPASFIYPHEDNIKGAPASFTLTSNITQPCRNPTLTWNSHALHFYPDTRPIIHIKP